MVNQFVLCTAIIITGVAGSALLLMIKGIKRRALGIFLLLFLIMQISGYGVGVEFFKAVVPHEDSGTSYQIISSTILPLIMAFGLSGLYNKFKKEENS